MYKLKILLPVFVLVALMQLYVPAKMILDREDVMRTGREYKFKTAPIDPNDPFRGKYITLRYEQNSFDIADENDWKRGEAVYVSLIRDEEGYAKIYSVSKEMPIDDYDFIKAKVSYISNKKMRIDYPFNRYYMKESKAFEAERIYRQSLIDTNQVTYALISIRDGDAVLKDVLIDGVSIREIVNQEK